MELHPLLARFDFPDPNAHSSKRVETITPLQKLFLLNSPFLITQSRTLAEQLLQSNDSDADRVESAYLRLYARSPSPAEIRHAESFLLAVAEDEASPSQVDQWTQYVQALMIANEMFLLD